MKVWLLYSSYDDGLTYESQGYKYLSKVVDSEEKAKQWAFDKAIEECDKRIHSVSESRKYLEKLDKYDLIIKEFDDELYYYDCQLNSFQLGDKSYVVHDPNGYESYSYYYEVREVE